MTTWPPELPLDDWTNETVNRDRHPQQHNVLAVAIATLVEHVALAADVYSKTDTDARYVRTVNSNPPDPDGNVVVSVAAVASTDITDSTATGRALLTAVDADAARTAIGAGTSSLVLGTTAGTAKAGDYQPTAANISDSTATGRALLTAVDAAAARLAAGLDQVNNTSDLAKPISTAVQDALDLKLDTADVFDSVVDTITSQTARIGLAVMVGYNDGGSAWPSVPTNLTTDANIGLHYVGGVEASPPPTSSGPALWDRPVV